MKDITKLISVRPYRGGFRYDWSKRKLEESNLTELLSVEKKRNYGYSSEEAAESHAEAKLRHFESVSDASLRVPVELRGTISFEVGKAIERGVTEEEILKVIRHGLDGLEEQTEASKKPISAYWAEFYASKTEGKNPDWGVPRNARHWHNFFEKEKENFFAISVSTFSKTLSGRDAVRDLFSRNKKIWGAKNTAKKILSLVREFLNHIEGRLGPPLDEPTIASICNGKKVVPKGLAEEASNFAFTPSMARSLLQWSKESERNVCGAMVLKLFMGARTMLLIDWKWSIVDWDKNTITIPKAQTKLKQGYSFSMADIPNLRVNLDWAWEQDGNPSRSERIVPCDQPTFTNEIKNWMNLHRDVFALPDKNGDVDTDAEIKPKNSHKNGSRSAFITYGGLLASDPKLTGFSVHKVGKIAEDRHCWSSYEDSSRSFEEAQEYFGMNPSDWNARLEF